MVTPRLQNSQTSSGLHRTHRQDFPLKTGVFKRQRHTLLEIPDLLIGPRARPMGAFWGKGTAQIGNCFPHWAKPLALGQVLAYHV
jgi:hypothetical protein